MRIRIIVLLLLLFPALAPGQNQTYYQYKTDEARLVFFDKNLSRYIPHMIRMFQNGKALHGPDAVVLGGLLPKRAGHPRPPRGQKPGILPSAAMERSLSQRREARS